MIIHQLEPVSMPETEASFAELYANSKYGSGEHIDSHLTAGDISIELGSELFDPAYHDAEDIDFSLEESIATGDFYVSTGLTTKPMVVGIAQDAMTRSQDPRIDMLKMNLSNRVASSIQGSVPQTDPINGMVVTDIDVQTFDFVDVAKVADRDQGIRKIESLALQGLAIVVSDFQNMNFKPKSLEGAVAIKINHVIEREVPLGIGTQAFGTREIDTRKPNKKLAQYNQEIEEQHQQTVARLQAVGARVVSLVADPRVKPYGFDNKYADKQLAKALQALSV